MLFVWLVGCAAPMYRFPGPLSGLGREPAEPPVASRRVPAAPPVAAPTPVRHAFPNRRTVGDEVVEAAVNLLGARSLQVDGKPYHFDCSGFVEASMARAGCYYRGSVSDLFDKAKELGVIHRRHTPSPGDVAFFDDTWDGNHNGKLDDPLSHVALVESVDDDGTIHMIHLGSQGIVRIVMNLRHPDERNDDDGKRINDYIRWHRRHDSPRTRYLAGELWVAFASFWKADPAASLSTR
jgi:hypothetical protein